MNATIAPFDLAPSSYPGRLISRGPLVGHESLRTVWGWLWKAAVVAAVSLAAPRTARGAATGTAVRQQGSLAFHFTSYANQTAELAVAGDGSKSITVSDNDGGAALVVSISGRGDENEIQFRVTDERDVTITLGYASGESVTVAMTDQPEGATVALQVKAGGFAASVIDPSADRVGVSLELIAVESVSGISIRYDDLPIEGGEGRVTPLFPGFLNEAALGGSVTLGATGMTIDSATVVALIYAAEDAAGLNEPDLRVHRFENTTGAFEPTGDNDRGIGASSTEVGDFGVDTGADTAWCVVDRLGTFAVGVTDHTLPAVVENDDLGGNGLGGTGGGICGALGMFAMVSMTMGLAAMRRRWRTT